MVPWIDAFFWRRMFSGCSEHSGLTENSIILKGLLILAEVSGVAGEFFLSNFEKNGF